MIYIGLKMQFRKKPSIQTKIAKTSNKNVAKNRKNSRKKFHFRKNPKKNFINK